MCFTIVVFNFIPSSIGICNHVADLKKEKKDFFLARGHNICWKWTLP